MNAIRKFAVGMYVGLMVVMAYYAVKMCFVVMSVGER
jgi:hypothetical protein